MTPRSLVLLALLVAAGCTPSAAAPPRRQPIIDVHLHAFGADWVNYFKDTSWFPPLPRPANNDSLREDAGFARNIMYGSDQAVWPAMIPYFIEGIESADFLSPEQKRAILCGNAARFLRLDPKLCEGGVQ